MKWFQPRVHCSTQSSSDVRPWCLKWSSDAPAPAEVMVKVGCVPTHSGSVAQLVTVQRTVDGLLASSTCITAGSGWLKANRSSPPVSPEPAASVHQAVRPSAVVSASNSASGVVRMRSSCW